ncbi:Fic family protein [Arthrobacter stackebrandtii]|uniref:Fic family protein n=1 Tax=Arthrobacter stackebrandtii TaxID=272161 RepID=A0ABS4Z0T7_9MICC|nr:Fic family protein [Arthrobacter stackebrandtii]MBP2414663.1 Fic family protein [Arthrobacter stackebrandtii]PYH01757.1 cell filamentation protein Fic [Arthrobacter stackebrandtii]
MPTDNRTTGWPALDYEELPWHSVGEGHASRTQRRRASGPYRAAVPPFISAQKISVDGELQALTEEASSELARFDAEVGQIAAPFASILLRTESASSSEIENLSSGARQIALAELGAHASKNAQLIVGNVRAMQAALSLSETIDGRAILEMHRALLEESNPGIVGHWRDQQVWIGGGNLGPHTAQFVPPHHDRVPALMEDLTTFANRLDLPVLIQIAIAHAQFETIHPFPDGNGRVGRALIQAMLRGGRLTRNVAVPVSAGLLHDTGSYFEALGAYRAGDIAPIVHSIAEASFAAVHNGRTLVGDLESVNGKWRESVKARRDSSAHRLLGVLLRQPVIDGSMAATELGVSSVNAQVAINRLVDAGILVQISTGKRNRIWLAKDVVRVLDDFGARARRRT